MAKADEKGFTKISISVELHEVVRRICDATKLKMYKIEDDAILEYVKNHYPEYLNGYAKGN